MIGADGLLSTIMSAGYSTPSDEAHFILFLRIGTTMISPVIAWTKVAFAITLLRVVRDGLFKYFLWFIIISGHLVLIPGIISLWLPECTSSETAQTCLGHASLQALGGIMFGTVSGYHSSRS